MGTTFIISHPAAVTHAAGIVEGIGTRQHRPTAAPPVRVTDYDLIINNAVNGGK